MALDKYESHVKPKLLVIRAWSRDGLTLDQIASNLQISKTTLIKYRKKHRELMNALKTGKEEADVVIENSMFKSAMGFNYKEQVVTNKGDVVTVEKFHPPSVTAQIFWLKNRKPQQWRDKQEVGVSGQVTHTNEQKTHIIHELVSDEGIAERIRANFRRGIVSGTSKE